MAEAQRENLHGLRPRVNSEALDEILFMSWAAELTNGNYVPVMIVGRPGAGKTSRVQATAEHFDLGYYKITSAGRTMEDIVGMAVPDVQSKTIQSVMVKGLMEFLRDHPQGVIALDDFLLGSPSEVGGFLDIIANGAWFGDHRQVMKFVVTTNYIEQVRPMVPLSAFNNRFVILDYDPLIPNDKDDSDVSSLKALLRLANEGASGKTFFDLSLFYTEQLDKRFPKEALRLDPIPHWRNLSSRERTGIIQSLNQIYNREGRITDEMVEILLRAQEAYIARRGSLFQQGMASGPQQATDPNVVKERLQNYLDYKTAEAKAAGIIVAHLATLGPERIRKNLQAGMEQAENDLIPYYSERALEMTVALAGAYIYARERGIHLSRAALEAAVSGTIGTAFSALASEIASGTSLPSPDEVIKDPSKMPGTYGGKAVVIGGLGYMIGRNINNYLATGDESMLARAKAAAAVLLKHGGVEETMIMGTVKEGIENYLPPDKLSAYKRGDYGEEAKQRASEVEKLAQIILAYAVNSLVNKEEAIRNLTADVEKYINKKEKGSRGVEPDF